MRITNKHSLPDAVYNVIAKEHYVAGESDYSATALLKPPQILALERRHKDELEEDAIDRVWSLFGHMAHALLEEHAHDESLAEQRLYVDLLGKRVGGQVDNYHEGTITDYKVTSAWTLVYGSRIHEWTEQLNIYSYIFRKNGYTVDKLQIVAILRDWDKNKAKQDHKYPQVPVVIIPLTLWTEEEQEVYITERVMLHKSTDKVSDVNLPECCSEEMWEQPAKWALMKEGGKRAIRVVEADEECDELAKQYKIDGKEMYWQKRPGKRTRCEEYCAVSGFCHQFKKYKEEQLEK